ncbi:MAG: hypothetical protein IT422_19275 [Pirellulaceae bacterium]|nr:hypothetical protein [Pirellulaceae bacterium]
MRFKLKTLFVVVGIAAIASLYLMIFTEGWRLRQDASSQLRKAGAHRFDFNNRNYLSYVSFTGEIEDPGLPDFVRIDRLDLTGCRDDKINLRNMRNADIWHLMLASTGVSDESMDQLTDVGQLRILDLTNTKVTDSAIGSIASIRGLEGVNLTGTEITLAGARHLKKLRPEIWLVHESLDVYWDGGELPKGH